MITQALVTNGAKVYITGRRQEVLENTVRTYNTGPGSLHALPGDISTKEGAIQLAKDLSAKESNGIHLLVNNAGIARDDNTKFCMYLPTNDGREKRITDASQRSTDSPKLPTPTPSASTSCAQKTPSGPIHSKQM